MASDELTCPQCGRDPVHSPGATDRSCCEAVRLTMVGRRFVIYPSIEPEGLPWYHVGLRLTDGGLVPIWWRSPRWATADAVRSYIQRYALAPDPEIEVLDFDPYPEPSPQP